MKPCPFCGKAPPLDLSDTCYPTGIYWREEGDFRRYVSHKERKQTDNACYHFICNEIYGGCGAEMHGDSHEEVIQKWERRI